MLEKWLLERLSAFGRVMYYIGLFAGVAGVVGVVVYGLFELEWFRGMSKREVGLVALLCMFAWFVAWGAACLVVWPRRDARGP